MPSQTTSPLATAPLPDNFRSVPLSTHTNRWRRFLAYAGPGFMISVGYMDPGNWATDLEGGSRFGYRLLWVILLSNLMAMLLQTLCVRLGLATGKDLAQACRDYYKRPAVIALWVLCEVAIVACDLAEVVGSAIAINLLSGGRIPLIYGVLLTGLDVLFLLGLSKFGFRKLEAIVLTLVATIAVCFGLEMFLSRPDWHGVITGMTHPSALGGEQLAVAVGILGATVMPHNLYLHSSLVKTRAHEETKRGIRQAINYNTLDTVVSLGAAFFVNAAILILAAAAFNRHGSTVTDLGDAHRLLTPLLGGARFDSLCGCPARFRTVFNDHRHFSRTDCDGGVSSTTRFALAQADRYQGVSGHSRNRHYFRNRRSKYQPVASLVAGRPFDATFFRYLSVNVVYFGSV